MSETPQNKYRTESKQIDDCTYFVTVMGAIQGRAAFTRLMNVIGPALAKSEEPQEAIGNLLSGMKESDMNYFCTVFQERTMVQTPERQNPVSLSREFDAHFAGKYDQLMGWLIFCVTVNFASFFANAGGLVDQVLPTASASPSQSTSTPTSGES